MTGKIVLPQLRLKNVLSLAAGSLLITGGILRAGPLTPPPGPIESTYKTLTEVEPRIAISDVNTPGDASSVFRISLPGSYYLTGNLTGVANKHGVKIIASGVTLDLNGFEVIGVPGGGAFDGIRTEATASKNITVRNGHVRNWGDAGIEFPNWVNSAGARVENVQATGNGGSGIACSTANGAVLHCSASENGSTGISATRLISGCTAADNGGSGLTVGQGGAIHESTAFSNGGDGLSTGFGCTVVDCTSDNNVGDGIEASNGTTITGCSFYANGGRGINVFTSVTIRNCTAVSNTLYGIDADTGCTIENNLANSNVLDGIRCGSQGVVRGNVARNNGSGTEVGAGIHVTGSDARVETNHCANNDFGVDIDGTSNIIIRNSCTGNTQAFVIAANNLYGPILDRRIPTTVASTPAVAGFAAISTLGSTDSNANFAY